MSLTSLALSFLSSLFKAKPKLNISTQELYLVKNFPNDSEVLNYADEILLGKLKVQHLINSLDFDINNFNWNKEETLSPNSYQLYLHALNAVAYLVRAYDITKNISYLNFAKKFYKLWLEFSYNKELSSKNLKIWHDHCISLRLDNIIYFALCLHENNILDQHELYGFKNQVIRHVEYLLNNKYYTKNHNHGVYQDRSLLFASYFIDDKIAKLWNRIAINRLKKQFDFAFNGEYVHTENSIPYNFSVAIMFYNLAKLIEKKHGNASYISNSLQKCCKFLTHIIKPNNQIEKIGDGENYNPEIALIFNNNELNYSISKGEKGSMPSETRLFLPKSGYYISRESWEKDKLSASTWLCFKCGYTNRTHKHRDDLAFTLYSKGYDIFIDSGFYNYNYNDKLHIYSVSPFGHNTVCVDRLNYSVNAKFNHNVGILDYEQNKNYSMISGFNNMYAGVNIIRRLYDLGELIIICDDIKANAPHEYSQLFHCSKELLPVLINSEDAYFKIADTDYNVRVQQFTKNTNAHLINGDYNGDCFGYIANKLNDIEKANTLRFYANANNFSFITSIAIENINAKNIKNFYYDELNKSFKIDNFEIKL